MCCPKQRDVTPPTIQPATGQFQHGAWGPEQLVPSCGTHVPERPRGTPNLHPPACTRMHVSKALAKPAPIALLSLPPRASKVTPPPPPHPARSHNACRRVGHARRCRSPPPRPPHSTPSFPAQCTALPTAAEALCPTPSPAPPTTPTSHACMPLAAHRLAGTMAVPAALPAPVDTPPPPPLPCTSARLAVPALAAAACMPLPYYAISALRSCSSASYSGGSLMACGR